MEDTDPGGEKASTVVGVIRESPACLPKSDSAGVDGVSLRSPTFSFQLFVPRL